MFSRMPLGGLIPARSKTDPAKQLKEYFTVIETEHDKERKVYEEVNSRLEPIGIVSFLFLPRQ